MKGIYDGYTTIERADESYFIGANTGRGFINCGETLLSEGRALTRLYILKGGAGTGKSTLLKKTAAEAKKRGHSVVTYLCGSDYESLDAVVIDGKVGVADGTSPHVMEMKYPGVCSSIVDVSRFLDEDKLSPHREEIVALSEKKGEYYRRAYQYLKAAEVLEGEMASVMTQAADLDKLRSYARRTARNCCGRELLQSVGERGVTSVYVGGITMKGQVGLSVLRDKAERVVSVMDLYGFASYFLEELGSAFAERGLSVVFGRIPVNDKVKELYLPELGVVYSVDAEGDCVKNIHLSRFVRQERYKQEAGRLKLTVKCIHSMVKECCKLLSQAGDAHFALEEINTSCMDFKGLNRFCNQTISGILGKLTTS